MQFRIKILLYFVVVSLGARAQAQVPVSARADARTRALLFNLHKAAGNNQILFGHQDDLAYGVGWKSLPGASDVRFACGDYPAVYGWELGHLEKDADANLDSVNFTQMKRWIREGYQRGGIITLSWHMSNYHSGGSAWDTTAAVKDILPGGIHHERYKQDLDRFARFVTDLKGGNWPKRHRIPIIFRPFHEHTGNWFWWGKSHVSPEDFKTLWRFTVRYLRDEKQLHQLLYAFSTSYNFTTAAEMLEFYPGDDWVDILGFDFYAYNNRPDTWEEYRRCQEILLQAARDHGKVPALTEFGYESIPENDWWTRVLLLNLHAPLNAGRVAYACAWRNANTKHHYVPFGGHASTPDFQEFYRHNSTLFEKDLWNFYKIPKAEITRASLSGAPQGGPAGTARIR
jgi:mannan endo-1,4-beta-mannosidase